MMNLGREKACAVLDEISAWSLYLMIFALPFAKSIIEITIVTALISLISKKVIQREKPFDMSVINLLLGLFLIASLVSLFNTSYMNLSLRALFSKSFKFAALFLITQQIINTKKKLNRFCITAAISCGIVVLDGLLQYYIFHFDLLHLYHTFGYSAGSLGAPTASFPFPNDYAAWLIVFIFPVGAYAFFGKGKLLKTVIASFLLAGLFYSLALTRVKGALIGFFISLGIFLFIKLKKLGIILLPFLLVAVLLINISRSADFLTIGSAKDRGVILQNSWEIFKKHPVIGNGLNTFFVEYREIRSDEDKGKRGSYAHNCYLQMAADTGLFGLTAFLAFVGAIIVKAFLFLRRVKDDLDYFLVLGLTLGIIAFLIHSAVDTNLYSLPLAALFWLSLGILMSIINRKEYQI